jgi:plastocyanin
MRLVRLIIAAAGVSGFLFACRATREHGVIIAQGGKATARVVVTMVGSATKESGPAETIKNFGEVYAFLPDVFAVRRDQPTQIIFWNLQPDDEHDFMLTDPANHVLLQTKFAPLSKTTYVMTFHDEGVFPFYCTQHQPAMSGQIIVTAPSNLASR